MDITVFYFSFFTNFQSMNKPAISKGRCSIKSTPNSFAENQKITDGKHVKALMQSIASCRSLGTISQEVASVTSDLALSRAWLYPSLLLLAVCRNARASR